MTRSLLLGSAANVLAGEQPTKKVYWVSVQEIVHSGLWYPADHDDRCLKRCNYYAGTHYCFHRGSLFNRWMDMMNICREANNYKRIFRRIKRAGFSAPVAAKVGHNNEYVTMVDGHHRVTVAYDLDLDLIPVYIGSRGTRLDNMIAIDSQGWCGTVNSPFFKEFYDAQQN